MIRKFSLPSSTYIISPLPLSLLCHLYSSLLPMNLNPHPFLFSLPWYIICLFASLSASLCHAFALLSSHNPPPPRNGFRWANFIPVMPLVCNSQFGISGKWPPLFIESLFIWTTWLFCPNPEITSGWLWKGWCVSVICSCLVMLYWHLCPVAMGWFDSSQVWRATRLNMERL